MMVSIYMCITDEGYCHIVFDNMLAAQKFCNRYPKYHVIIRELHTYQPKEN
jgi:hypothetical protein